MLKNIVIAILSLESRYIIKKYKPRVIGVTGTVGKTSTKDAIALVLSEKYSVRQSAKSYNSEIGLPLTVIGAENQWSSVIGWLGVMTKGFLLILLPRAYPEILILEMGVDAPKDMDKLARIVSLDVAVITMLGAVPVHVEAFGTPEKLYEEKLKIIGALKPSGTLVLNYDDAELRKRRNNIEHSARNIVTYGFDENSNMHGSNYVLDGGVTFKAEHGGRIVPVRMRSVLGVHNANVALAALAVGILFGVHLIAGATRLSAMTAPRGRLRLLDGVNDSRILDDSYNSSPLAVRAALKVLKDLPATGRKIAVLGDMRELGRYSIDAHKHIGREIVHDVDVIVTIGDDAKFIADSATEVGFDTKKVFRFRDVDEAKDFVTNSVGRGDVVLVKGSQSVRLEKLVSELLADKTQTKNLLVRQDEEWEKR